MPQYQLKHAYTSRRDGRTFGPWAVGDVVDLDQDDADWIDRDSPGALTTPAAADPEPEPEPEAERAAKPTPNRQRKGGPNRGA
jgi:hypothetical protein